MNDMNAAELTWLREDLARVRSEAAQCERNALAAYSREVAEFWQSRAADRCVIAARLKAEILALATRGRRT